MNMAGRFLARAGAFFVLSVAAVFASACSPGVVPTDVPTQVLIPSTPTHTPTPIPPTSTPLALPRPEDVVVTPLAPGPDATPVINLDLIQRVIADLVSDLEIDPEAVKVVRVEAAVWTNIDLGCGDGPLPTLDLNIKGFRLVLAVENTLYEYHTDDRAKIRRCPHLGVSNGTTNMLVEVDPIAAEMVALAQRRVAEVLDLPTRRIRLVDVIPVTWTESSLGCPLPDQDYVPLIVQGYRIVLAAGEAEYIFHTDTQRIMACEPENERLPVEP